MKKILLLILGFILFFSLAVPVQKAEATQVFNDVSHNHTNNADIYVFIS